MPKRVFIDGESGTTGLEIFRRLAGRADLTIVSLPPDKRKDPAARWEALNACDLAVLCLPDAAAVEAVAMVENPHVRVLDASTAHRVKPGWVYGFAEMTEGQADRIAAASFVANPGCYATGAIALLRPLIDAGVLTENYPVTINAVSGYTGGGKAMIAAYEDPAAPDPLRTGYFEYGLSFEHKHLAEIQAHAGLGRAPLFVPSVARFPRGMLVNLPLSLDAFGGAIGAAELQAIYRDHYPTHGQVRVHPLHRIDPKDNAAVRLEADELADTDWLDIHVYDGATTGHVLAVASLDNLGKGACGAAIQNIDLMLDLAPARAAVSSAAE